MEQSLVQDRLKFWYDQGIHMICCDLWVCCFMCLCNTISYQESMAGMVVMDVDKAECFVYRSFMRTWLARRICESAGIAWIAFVFQVFSWTGGENAGTTETAQEGKSEYELELYGGAEDSSGACVSRPLSSQVSLCILCEFMTRNFQDHLPVRVVEPLIKARKDLREKGEKAEETMPMIWFWYFWSALYDRPWNRAWCRTDWIFDMIKEYTWCVVICEFVVSCVFATRFPIRKAWPAWSWWTWTRLNVLYIDLSWGHDWPEESANLQGLLG